jgi:4'-phosphopantetheinyl transferase
MIHAADAGRGAGPQPPMPTWWLARAEAQLPAAGDWLSPAERQHAGQLRYTKRRTDYLLARWTLKIAVARTRGWPDEGGVLARIEGRSARSGAPELHIDGKRAAHGISLSDRAGFAVCLVAAQAAAVGCDLELVEPRSDAFVRDYLTESEGRLVAAAGDARDLAANLLWSAKESALKALGTGLRRDTRSVEVRLTDLAPPPGRWSELNIHTDEGAHLPGWWRRSGPFLLTVAGAALRSAPAGLDDRSPLDESPPSHRWLDRPLG